MLRRTEIAGGDMEEQVEKSCWGVTFWAVAIVVAVAALFTLANGVEVVENVEPEGKPAAVAAAG
ncbi:MAG: hypothetical protein AAF903_14380 [Pseudomonadota bacterium]